MSGGWWAAGEAGGGLQGCGLLTGPACLQNSSKGRLRSLESLHGFVAAATKELMWLSEKEEEEVGFDWSERNSNMAAKKESYSVRRATPSLSASTDWQPRPWWPPDRSSSGTRGGPRAALGGSLADPGSGAASETRCPRARP